MTRGFTLGRAVYVDPDSAGGADVGGYLKSARGSGDDLAIVADLNGATVTDLLWWRNMVGNRDESVVRFTAPQRADLDGFYRVLSTGTEVEGDLSNGNVVVAANLQRIPASRYPRIEVLSHGKLRVNTNSVTDGNVTACIGIPTTGVDALDAPAGSTVTSKARSGATLLLSDAFFGPSSGKPAVCSYQVEPADYYDGAPSLLLPDLTTGEWRPVIGRPVSSGVDGFRIDGTGFTIEGGVDSAGDFELSIDGQPILIGAIDAGDLLVIGAAPVSFVVLRNSPELVAVRVVLGTSATSQVVITISVRRGQRHASLNLVNLNQPVGLASAVGVWLPESSGATDLNGGTRMNTAVGGHRYWLACPDDETASTPYAGGHLGTVYGLLKSAASSADVDNVSFAVGVETSGSSATGEDTAQNCIYQWYAAQTERQVVTGL